MPLTLYPLATIRTHNTKENPAEKIGQLWQNNFAKLLQNEPYYGVYLNYESDFTGYYDVAVAQELGYVVKLVGSIEETASGIAAEVTPTFLPKAHPLASVNGVMNAVFVESIGIGESMYYGPGAGQKPTATSVVADIVRIVRRLNDGTIGKDFNEYSRDLVLANPEDVKANYYFSILAPDSKGQVLKLAEIFNAEDISFKQILQDGNEGDKARVVIITHKINKKQLENVSDKLKKVTDFDLLNTFKVLGV